MLNLVSLKNGQECLKMIDENRKKLICYILSAVMIVAMVGCAEMLHELEIIFPEIVALVIGAWIAKKQPWKVSKIKIVGLMTIASVFGIGMVRYVNIPLLGQIIIAFIFAAILLMVSHCTMVPIISACILPILMNTSSLSYPVSVFVMSLIIVVVQKILERVGLREKEKESSCVINLPFEIIMWSMMLLVFAVIGAFAVCRGEVFLIAPPLIVTFVSFSYPNSKVRKKAIPIYILIAIAAWIGAMGRLFLNVNMGLSLTMTTVIIIAVILTIFWTWDKLFPPAGAIALLPLIISENKLVWYPMEVMIGSALLIGSAMIIGKRMKK